MRSSVAIFLNLDVRSELTSPYLVTELPFTFSIILDAHNDKRSLGDMVYRVVGLGSSIEFESMRGRSKFSNFLKKYVSLVGNQPESIYITFPSMHMFINKHLSICSKEVQLFKKQLSSLHSKRHPSLYHTRNSM